MKKMKFSKEIKEFWDEYGSKIKIGTKWLAIGLAIGFVEGVLTTHDRMGDALSRLADRIPPDETDFKNYIITHFDEFEDFIKEESQYDHSYLEEP